MRGHIRKRGKRFAAVVYLGRDATTKKAKYQWFSGHRTRKEAETHLTDLLKTLHGGGWMPDSAITVSAFLAEWLDKYAKGAVAPTTARCYGYYIDAHIVPHLGHLKLKALTPIILQTYLAGRLAAGLSPTTVRSHYNLLKQALKHAVRWRYLSVNPADHVDAPKRARRELTMFSLDQVSAFLDAAKASRYPLLFQMAVLTGMRQGELLGLRWKDVNPKAGVLTVNQTFYRLGSTVIFKPPKTAASRRRIELPPDLIDALAAHRRDQAIDRSAWGEAYEDEDLVFAQENGRPLHAHDVTLKDLRGVLDAAELPRIRFHDLRHLHASLLFALDTHPKTVQARLGHTSIGITMDLYTHLVPGVNAEKKAAAGVAALVAGKTGRPARRE